jgi:RNA polymerase sigma-70 factor (ECF subfamily)
VQFHSFDTAYIRRLTDGDPETEAHFASYFGELIKLKLAARMRSPVLAEDIRQETLLRVLRALRRGAGVEHPERFGAFVNTVCNNVMYEFFRTANRDGHIEEQVHEPVDTSVNLDRPIEESDTEREVSQVLATLPAKDRELLRAVFIEERDKDEICRRFNVDANYLRVLLHRAKGRFRKAYQRRAETPSAGAPV